MSKARIAASSPRPPSYQASTATSNGTSIQTGLQAPAHLPWYRKLSYGVGHVFNDLCASMWFTYLVLFYHKVVLLENAYAGLLILIGQVADAMATPIIGFLCDKTHFRYGRRKLWHLIGSVMVGVSLFFVWHTCLACNASSPLWAKIIYFSIPIIVFQFGWASVQISHLSLIPELTSDKHDRVGLNAIRYGFTILSNIGVYVAMFLLLLFVKASPSSTDSSSNSTATLSSLLDVDVSPYLKHTSLDVWAYAPNDAPHKNLTDGDEINPGDVWIFSGTALGIIAVGSIFSLLFQVGTREPYIPKEERLTQYQDGRVIKWYRWFLNPHFYFVAVIYMCTRLINNLVQAYTPLYLIESLHLTKISVAIGPLVMYVSGFLATLVLKVLNRVVGRYMAYFLGIAFVWGGLLWFQGTDPPERSDIGMNVVVYGATFMVGAGGATILVTSLSMVADLIDNTTGSSAFVYGLMSFTDKLSSGVVIQIIQALHPCKSEVCCSKCGPYYREVLVYVPSGATVLAVLALICLVILIYFNRRKTQTLEVFTDSDKRSTSPSINTTPTIRSVSPLLQPIMDKGSSGNEKKPLLSRSTS